MTTPFEAMPDLDAAMPTPENGGKPTIDLKKLQKQVEDEMGALDLGNM